MGETEKQMEMLAKQEKTLIFRKFDQEDAVAIGLRLFEKAKAERKQIAVHISLNHRDMFHLSMDGCAPDNDIWLRKKENMVYRFLQSSFSTVAFCEMMGTNVFDFYALDIDTYVGAGGGFPVNVEGAGVVGAICCGGMMPHEDHQIIVDVLKEYLGK